MVKMKEYTGTGRRKTAVAAVRLRPGEGKIDINGRSFEQYFPDTHQRQEILAPLAKFALKEQFNILIRVSGGGIHAQAGAARLGISRALVGEDETRRHDLKELGYLTRDPRKRERKKYGRAGARKRFQFSKR
jgi:small subunit ribosomal protein S9